LFAEPKSLGYCSEDDENGLPNNELRGPLFSPGIVIPPMDVGIEIIAMVLF
jgi:hypothetical protein